MARELALAVYKASESFPPHETYGMRRQLRSAVTSIAANIAEGFGRYHYKDNLKFLYNARGSLAETESFLLLALDLGYLEPASCSDIRALCERQLRVLNGYIKATRSMVSDRQEGDYSHVANGPSPEETGG